MTAPNTDPAQNRVQEQVLLEVKNLGARLPSKHGMVKAVDRVSFSLSKGKTLGLVGESGCGKTMLARAIMGLLPKSARISPGAVVRFNGKNLLAMKKKEMRRIMGKDMALVFQDPMTALNPVMKIGRQVAEVMECHLDINGKTAAGRTVALLEQVGVPMPERRARQYPHQLSGGLRQRVAIAAALACSPKLLIADEPTTALDVTVQAQILDLLAGLQKKKNMSMILITHDFGVVARRTDETAVMYAGKIVEHARTRHLFNGAKVPYTRALMDAIPRLSNGPHDRLRTIGGAPPDPARLPPGCAFAPRCWKRRAVCLEKEPVLKPVNSSGHRAACWYPLDEHES